MCNKISVPRGVDFIKVILVDLDSTKEVEKKFKIDQTVEKVSLEERTLEFLYPEGGSFLFLDLTELEQINVAEKIVKKKIDFLKEGIQVKAIFYGEKIFSVELPQFLELMIARTEELPPEIGSSKSTEKLAVLETGAKVEVPMFIESGDIIKVDTFTNEFVQRL